MEQRLTIDIFNENMNTKYRVESQENESIELELVKCEKKEVAGLEAFTLIFEGTADNILYDNTYKFEHNNMGSFHIFISPYRQDGDKVYYDAQFTKVVD